MRRIRRNGALNALGKYGPAHIANLRQYLADKKRDREAALAARKPVESATPAEDDDVIEDLIAIKQEMEHVPNIRTRSNDSGDVRGQVGDLDGVAVRDATHTVGDQ